MRTEITIAERGWVFVGKTTREGDQVVIHEAKNIRIWGTTGGLGELALQGPRPNTRLDNYGTIRIHVLAVVASIECNEVAWSDR